MSLIRRLLDSRRLGRRIRRRWQYTRPFPLPHYTAGTPKIAGSGPLDIFLPANPSTVGAAALEATAAVEAVLAKMTQIEEIQALHTYYRASREKFGDHWRYADLLTALWAAATLNPPTTYLEVGVRTGRSAAVVGAAVPGCDIYGFDLWPPDYAGTTIRGPDFVRGELERVGHTGSVTLVSGDSSKTLTAFLREHPDLYFDLVTIDLNLDKSTRYADGRELALQIRERFGDDFPIIIVTGTGDLEEQRRAFKEYNVFDFIEKAKLDMEEFQRVVLEAVGGSRS